jgi:small subunit ribosomal protein S6
MRKYETTFVLDAGVDQSVLEKELGVVEGTITEGGGKVLDIEKWGVRRFAYEIKKRHQGNYIHVKFEAPGDVPDQLTKKFRINEKILRYLTVLSPFSEDVPVASEIDDPHEEDIHEEDIHVDDDLDEGQDIDIPDEPEEDLTESPESGIEEEEDKQ